MPGIAIANHPLVPGGFPSYVDGPMTWKGENYEDNPQKYTCELNGEDIVCVEEALRFFKGTVPGKFCLVDQSSKWP